MLQRSMIYFPTPLVNHTAEFIELEQPDATLRISTRFREGRQAVLYFGGNAEDVSYSLHELERNFPEAAIYALHYRGYSGSTGSPSEPALHADAQALFDRVRSLHSDIIVVGRSLGSGVAVPLAADNEVKHLILLTPFDSLLNVARHHYPLLPVGSLLLDRYESHLRASQIKTPTTIFIAEHDTIVPRKCSTSLAQAFPEGVCQTFVVPSTDHNSITLSEAVKYSHSLESQP
jgi:pimeloyl-ACP methyl ester carboxylesterase